MRGAMDIAKTLHDLGEFTGDILFKDAHPIVWQGPVTNWITACDRLTSRRWCPGMGR